MYSFLFVVDVMVEMEPPASPVRAGLVVLEASDGENAGAEPADRSRKGLTRPD
jgi:hypothetical protein